MTSPISPTSKSSTPYDEDLTAPQKNSLLKPRFLEVLTRKQKHSLKKFPLPPELPILAQTEFSLTFNIPAAPEPFTGVRTEELENGDTYQGLFKDGLFHGFGLIRDANGKARFRGLFHLGKKVCGQESPPGRPSKYFDIGPRIFAINVCHPQTAVFVRYDVNERLIEAFRFVTKGEDSFEFAPCKRQDSEWICGDEKIPYSTTGTTRMAVLENERQEGFGINQTETEYYVGMFKNGKYHGFGHLNLADEHRTIVGIFEEGELISGQEDIFTGLYQNRQKSCGITPNGGRWSDGKAFGKHTHHSSDGRSIFGSFFNGKLTGLAKVNEPDGKSLNIRFINSVPLILFLKEKNAPHIENSINANNQLTGFSIIPLKNGDAYKGLFVDGLAVGFGIITNPDGELKFTGNFQDGKKKYGIEVIDENTSYVGSYSKNARHVGCLVDPTSYNIYYYGPFKNNEPANEKAPPKGELRDGKKFGYHKIEDAKGKILEEGIFENDLLHVYGRRFQIGESYSGTMRKGKYHGIGALSFGSRIIMGTFKHGELITGQEIGKDGTLFVGPYKNREKVDKI